MKRLLAVIFTVLLILPALPQVHAHAVSGAIENLTWDYAPETCSLTVSGEGELRYYSSYPTDTPPWYDYREEILDITVSEGITALGQ